MEVNVIALMVHLIMVCQNVLFVTQNVQLA